MFDGDVVGERRLQAHRSSIGIANDGLHHAPMLRRPRLHDVEAIEHESARVADPEAEVLGKVGAAAFADEEGWLAGRMAQRTGVVIGLEVEVVAQPLPERDGRAPVGGLDVDVLDAAPAHFRPFRAVRSM
jgi:hypothetical protein